MSRFILFYPKILSIHKNFTLFSQTFLQWFCNFLSFFQNFTIFFENFSIFPQKSKPKKENFYWFFFFSHFFFLFSLADSVHLHWISEHTKLNRQNEIPISSPILRNSGVVQKLPEMGSFRGIRLRTLSHLVC